MDKKEFLKTSFKNARSARIVAKSIDLFIVLLLSIFFYPAGLILGIIYLSLADSLQLGQSVGKKIIGLAVISLEDGSPCSTKQSFVRNLPLIVPLAFAIIPLWGWFICMILTLPIGLFELYLLFKLDSGKRLGDVMADTSVVADIHQQQHLKRSAKGWFDPGAIKPFPTHRELPCQNPRDSVLC